MSGKGGKSVLRTVALGGFFVAAMVYPVQSQSTSSDDPSNEEFTPDREQPYSVELKLTNDPGGLENYLTNVSRLEVLKAEPPGTLEGIRQRLDVDLGRFNDALRSRGYYAATVKGELRPPAAGADDGAHVIVNIDPGPLYTIKKVEIQYTNSDVSDVRPENAEDAGLEIGSAAEAARVTAGDATIANLLRKRGFAFAKTTDRRVIVNHNDRSMEITYWVDSGPFTRFGELKVSGTENVNPDFLQNMRTWEPGEDYSQDQVDTYRKRLSETRLFTVIELGAKQPLDEQGRAPIELNVMEGPARTISGGLAYSTDSGFTAKGRWEHRNLMGHGELFRVGLTGGYTEQSVNFFFRKPYFLNPNQSLTAGIDVGRKDYDAYTGYTFNANVNLERSFWDHWHASIGVAFDGGYLTWPEYYNDDYVRHMLFGLPMQLIRDETDSVLDPTIGTKFSLMLTPYTGTVDSQSSTFLTTTLSGSAYYPFFNKRLVLAGRARLASISGADMSKIPPNRRLYAGGGGSVRGFGYQMIGPLGPGDDPIGGRSAMDGGFEMRIKITEQIGIVPFIEAGVVGPESYPSFDETVRVGAGLGFRYYTDFGPVRVDLGVPLNRRKQDDKWQIYVSLGQAF